MKIIGTGIDIIEIARIKQAVKRWDKNFLEHIFHDEEISYAKKHKFPEQHLAARFAAKEAIFKAVGDPKISWKDILILNDKEGKPYCQIKSKKGRPRIIVHISLSHTKNYAVAHAIAEKQS